MLTEEKLQDCIKNYRENDNSDDLIECLEDLVKRVLLYHKWNFATDGIIEDAIDLCLQKVEKYNSKYKASNFFMTIIGCYLAQVRRRQR